MAKKLVYPAKRVKDSIAFGYVINRATKQWPGFYGGKVDRTKYLMASEATVCSRQLAFSKSNNELYRKLLSSKHAQTTVEALEVSTSKLDQSMYGYFARGDAVETWVVEQVKAAISAGKSDYVALLNSGEEQRTMTYGHLGATQDGILVNKRERCFTFEVKSATKLPVRKPIEDYYTQTNIGLYLAKKHQQDLPGPVVGAIIVHIDPSNYFVSSEHKMLLDRPLIKRMIAKSKALFPTKSEVIEPHLAVADVGGRHCYMCPFKNACAAIENGNSVKTKRADALIKAGKKLW